MYEYNDQDNIIIWVGIRSADTIQVIKKERRKRHLKIKCQVAIWVHTYTYEYNVYSTYMCRQYAPLKIVRSRSILQLMKILLIFYCSEWNQVNRNSQETFINVIRYIRTYLLSTPITGVTARIHLRLHNSYSRLQLHAYLLVFWNFSDFSIFHKLYKFLENSRCFFLRIWRILSRFYKFYSNK